MYHSIQQNDKYPNNTEPNANVWLSVLLNFILCTNSARQSMDWDSARRPRALCPPQTLEITTKSNPNINFDISAISGPILEILFFKWLKI